MPAVIPYLSNELREKIIRNTLKLLQDMQSDKDIVRLIRDMGKVEQINLTSALPVVFFEKVLNQIQETENEKEATNDLIRIIEYLPE
jgi:hypothetical protein